MAVNRYYSSTAAKTALNGGITNSATSILVNALTGYPVSTPWTAILDRDTATEEVVTVTSVSGLTATVVRGVDGTSGVAHSSGGTFEHGVSARDFTEPQAHIAAVSGVHGLTGSVVGDSDIQTLSSKTLASPAFTGTATGLSAASAVLDAASTLGGVSGTSIAAGRTAWGTWTPVAVNVPTSATAGFFKQIGKSVYATGQINLSGAATGTITVSLPVAANLRFGVQDYGIGTVLGKQGTSHSTAIAVLSGGDQTASGVVYFQNGPAIWNITAPFTWATGGLITFSVTYEAA